MVLDLRVDEALEKWILKIIKNAANNNIEAKMIRANKLGILRLDFRKKSESEEFWNKIRLKIGTEDNWLCHKCKNNDIEMHIHHIIHRSKFGTSNKKNLITVCKKCHEDIHQRIFDNEV